MVQSRSAVIAGPLLPHFFEDCIDFSVEGCLLPLDQWLPEKDHQRPSHTKNETENLKQDPHSQPIIASQYSRLKSSHWI
jgi:hypothetical protein